MIDINPLPDEVVGFIVECIDNLVIDMNVRPEAGMGMHLNGIDAVTKQVIGRIEKDEGEILPKPILSFIDQKRGRVSRLMLLYNQPTFYDAYQGNAPRHIKIERIGEELGGSREDSYNM